eukprot:3326652-Rhodomonas_salina.2
MLSGTAPESCPQDTDLLCVMCRLSTVPPTTSRMEVSCNSVMFSAHVYRSLGGAELKTLTPAWSRERGREKVRQGGSEEGGGVQTAEVRALTALCCRPPTSCFWCRSSAWPVWSTF